MDKRWKVLSFNMGLLMEVNEEAKIVLGGRNVKEIFKYICYPLNIQAFVTLPQD